MTSMMSGATTTVAMIGTTITATATMTTVTGVVIGKMTPRGGRTATAQWITPSTPSSQGPSVTMKKSTPRSSRVHV
jgi:hypothetical protein